MFKLRMHTILPRAQKAFFVFHFPSGKDKLSCELCWISVVFFFNLCKTGETLLELRVNMCLPYQP